MRNPGYPCLSSFTQNQIPCTNSYAGTGTVTPTDRVDWYRIGSGRLGISTFAPILFTLKVNLETWKRYAPQTTRYATITTMAAFFQFHCLSHSEMPSACRIKMEPKAIMNRGIAEVFATSKP